MNRSRQKFYDLFSRFYDGFVRFHSRDEGQRTRAFLVEQLAPQPGRSYLDLCTGTGDVAMKTALALNGKGQVVGLDFSLGMLRRAQKKRQARGVSRAYWIQGSATRLPLRAGSIRGITCSHALYEIKGSGQREVLEEVARVLVPGGRLCLMEHALPSSMILKLLLRLRSFWTGGMDWGLDALNKVQTMRRRDHLLAPGGGSWVMVLERVQGKTG